MAVLCHTSSHSHPYVDYDGIQNEVHIKTDVGFCISEKSMIQKYNKGDIEEEKVCLTI